MRGNPHAAFPLALRIAIFASILQTLRPVYRSLELPVLHRLASFTPKGIVLNPLI